MDDDSVQSVRSESTAKIDPKLNEVFKKALKDSPALKKKEKIRLSQGERAYFGRSSRITEDP